MVAGEAAKVVRLRDSRAAEGEPGAFLGLPLSWGGGEGGSWLPSTSWKVDCVAWCG